MSHPNSSCWVVPDQLMNYSVEGWKQQSFNDLKSHCISQGRLFEDPEFPASDVLLVDDRSQSIISYIRTTFTYGKNPDIEWLRPHEICQKMKLPHAPMFIVDGADRFDINQGSIGNCWFLAALANLAENEKCFKQVVPYDKDENPFEPAHYYAGIFRFRFWRFGQWEEIVIDDRLPTIKGSLIYLRSVQKNEFWGALLEKAYAKLHGSYKALEAGLSMDAAVEFSGGIPEYIAIDLELEDPGA